MNNHLENVLTGVSLFEENGLLREEYEERLHGEGEMADGKGGFWLDQPKIKRQQLPLSKENQYFRDMIAWEDAQTLKVGALVADSVQLIDLASATDEEVARSLRELVTTLCAAGHRVVCSEHLSDRALYLLIERGILRCNAKVLAEGQFIEWFCCFHTENLLPLDRCNFEIYFRYYAEDFEKRRWNKKTPVPQRIAPPFIRPYAPKHRPIFLP